MEAFNNTFRSGNPSDEKTTEKINKIIDTYIEDCVEKYLVPCLFKNTFTITLSGEDLEIRKCDHYINTELTENSEPDQNLCIIIYLYKAVIKSIIYKRILFPIEFTYINSNIMELNREERERYLLLLIASLNNSFNKNGLKFSETTTHSIAINRMLITKPILNGADPNRKRSPPQKATRPTMVR